MKRNPGATCSTCPFYSPFESDLDAAEFERKLKIIASSITEEEFKEQALEARKYFEGLRADWLKLAIVKESQSGKN